MASPFNYNAAQQAAFEALAAMGACIGKYDESFIHVEMTPAFGQTPIGDAEMPRVIGYINEIGNVRNLDLGETAITDASAHELSRLKNVVFLSLNGTSVSNLALPSIMMIASLQELVMSGTGITDDAVGQLASMRELTFLQLYGTQMSAEGLAALKTMLPGVVEA